MATEPAPFTIGWEEWVALPELGLPAIKAKVDTGARTSALHAFQIEPFGGADAPKVRFGIHPIPGRTDLAVYCSAPVVDRREVISSNGEREVRFVIQTCLAMGGREWPIEVTLTNREAMTYRMLLGRQAIREDIRVDPAASFLQPKLSYRAYRHLPRFDLVRRALRIALLTRRPGSPSSRRLAAAARARGHELETVDPRKMALVLDAAQPGVMVEGSPLGHYDALIPRLTSEDGQFGAAVVRQFELMGSHSMNRADAIERLLNPLATRQVLAQQGLAAPSLTVSGADPERPLKRGRSRSAVVRLLVVGGNVAAAVVPRQGKWIDAGARDLASERAMARRAAAALGLGLVAIDVGEDDAGPAIFRISATPSLAEFEAATGVMAAEQVIVQLERQVRSWVRQADAVERG